MSIYQKIESLIHQSIALYKHNFKIFTKLSLILAAIGFGHELIINVLLSQFEIKNELLYWIIYGIISIPIYYYTIRFNIAFLITIRYRTINKEITILNSFGMSKHSIVRYFLVNLKLILIIVIPVIIIAIVYALDTLIIIKILATLISGLVFIGILVNYMFAPFISIFQSFPDDYFRRSKKLTSTNYKLIVFVIIVLTIIGLIIYFINENLFSFTNNWFIVILRKILNLGINVFTTPILSGIYVLLFNDLLTGIENTEDILKE